jgi:glycosyltransferase involved in cell wall biosynthesis
LDWIVATPDRYDSWLEPFVPGGRHRLVIHPRPADDPNRWHKKSRGITTSGEWFGHWGYARAAWRRSRGGVITLFPQLATAVGLLKRLSGRAAPIVAWDFNLGQLYPGLKRTLARASLGRVDRFVAHSRRECARYAEWLGLPAERFRYVPLQCFAIPVTEAVETDRPFLLAMGSAQRDYKTLFEAVGPLNLRTVVVAAPRAVDGLDVPGCVEVRSGISIEECQSLAQRARLSVVPVANDATASGQVTVVQAMRMGRPVIATRCMGTEDYIESGQTGVLVPLGSAPELSRAIQELWDDEPLRRRLGANAQRHAAEHFSDEAAGKALGLILDELEDGATRG